MKNILTASEVAEILGINSSRVRQLSINPGIPGSKKTSAGWLIPRSALNKPPLNDRGRPGRKKGVSYKQKRKEE